MPVDLEVPDRDPLLADTQLLHHPAAGPVPRHDGDLHTVQSEHLEGKTQDRHRRLGGDRLFGHGLIDPVADEGVLERTSLDGGQGDLTHEAIRHEDPEAVPAPHLALPLPGRAPVGEAGAILRGERCPGGPWLPRDEPPTTAGPHLEPALVVVLAQGPQSDPPSTELEGGGTRRPSDHRPNTSPSAPSSNSTLRSRAVWPMQPMRHARPAMTPTPAPISIP